LSINYENQTIRVTATFGLASVSGQVVDQEHLLQIADRALYKGKTSGRNVVVLADESLIESAES
jgi:PleD family two-component response regulator